MTDIIDLNERKNAASKPDADCVHHDVVNGKIVTTYKFCGSYTFEGNDWAFDLWATDLEQAQRKLTALSAGRIDGQVYGIIPA